MTAPPSPRPPAPARRDGPARAPGYHREILRLYRHIVPRGASVLQPGCGTGSLLAGLEPGRGVGVDADAAAVAEARARYAGCQSLSFLPGSLESFDWSQAGTFDYIVLSDTISTLHDVQALLSALRCACTPRTRLVLTFPSNAWRPLLGLAARIGWRERPPVFNWLSPEDVANLLRLAGFEIVSRRRHILIPLRIPVLAWAANRLLPLVPGLSHLCLTNCLVARPRPQPAAAPRSVSVVIPTRNERDNIEPAFRRTPPMGLWTELLFVDGRSTDGTLAEIERCRATPGQPWRRVEVLTQSGKGKGNAVREAFAAAQGDVLMILDSDLTMPPEELPKFYDALVNGEAELVNGCRLVYEMEGEAMRFLNMLGNFFFARLFSWLLGQPVKDTLCGTKVLWRSDYEAIAAHRAHFGDFDPFGDFDLLFGAARLNRRIVDLPIRYRRRTYGEIKIDRWRDGALLLRMSWIAFRKLKLV